MIPPKELNVIHNDPIPGFICETKGRNIGTSTLWRPAVILEKYNSIGILQSYNEKSFFQLNDDVTKAKYKVKGYRYPIICWFDNKTGKRIA